MRRIGWMVACALALGGTVAHAQTQEHPGLTLDGKTTGVITVVDSS